MKLSTYPQFATAHVAHQPAIRYSQHMDDSTLMQSLAEHQAAMIRRCVDETQRLQRKLLFGMTTSLALQSIAQPDHCDLDTSLLHTVSRTSAKRVRTVKSSSEAHIWKYVNEDACVQISTNVYTLDLLHTWAQLSTHLPLIDLVILGDAILTRRDAPSSCLAEFTRNLGYFRGKQQCRQAAKLVSTRVQSPMETKVRLAASRHGLPKAVTNYTVPDARFSSGIDMTLDLAWPNYRVAVEYDGDHHRTDKTQWRRDREKREYLQSHEWIIMSITAANVADDMARAEFALRLARYLANRGATFTFKVLAMSLEETARLQDAENTDKKPR
ncbi:hypothetical protein BHAP_1787 [Bifidobacterium hapali]|uniref:DUF559 domain-containing protein n=1 Tax=Bifidobacterium hapali TaxID=1630172 RepID=A0A261FWP0_9BIFI|nr:hypothetical protein [Bifidobacterium hapali]OZG63600.1 hypothetical protein BHAP_1787 [Bifidobacterium hapali]